MHQISYESRHVVCTVSIRYLLVAITTRKVSGDVPNTSGIPLPIHHLTLALSTGRVDLQRVRHVEW